MNPPCINNKVRYSLQINTRYIMRLQKFAVSIFIFLFYFSGNEKLLKAQSAMTNIYARNIVSLNGDWHIIADPAGSGDWRRVWLEKKPEKKAEG